METRHPYAELAAVLGLPDDVEAVTEACMAWSAHAARGVTIASAARPLLAVRQNDDLDRPVVTHPRPPAATSAKEQIVGVIGETQSVSFLASVEIEAHLNTRSAGEGTLKGN